MVSVMLEAVRDARPTRYSEGESVVSAALHRSGEKYTSPELVTVKRSCVTFVFEVVSAISSNIYACMHTFT